MQAMSFLINTLFDLYLTIVILRIWLQLARADFYNPFCQFIVKATHPIVAPLRRVLPSFGNIDTASIVLALAVVVVKLVLLSLINSQPLALPIFVLIAVVSAIKQAGVLFFWMVIIRAILSWFNQSYNPIVLVMEQLTEPLLAPVRRVIPPIGGLDLSVMIVIIGLNFVNMLCAQYIPFWAFV